MTEFERELFTLFLSWEIFAENIPAGMNERDAIELIDKFVDYKCDHDLITVYKLQSNGVKLYRKQCRKCAEVIGNAIKHTPEIERIAVLEAPTRYHEINEMRRDARSKIMDRWKSRKDSEWWKAYEIYLQSPEWAAKRLKVFKRANWICEGCGDERATEVHHLSYAHVFHEYLFELVALCRRCHHEITASAQRPGGAK